MGCCGKAWCSKGGVAIPGTTRTFRAGSLDRRAFGSRRQVVENGRGREGFGGVWPWFFGIRAGGRDAEFLWGVTYLRVPKDTAVFLPFIPKVWGCRPQGWLYLVSS